MPSKGEMGNIALVIKSFLLGIDNGAQPFSEFLHIQINCEKNDAYLRDVRDFMCEKCSCNVPETGLLYL